MHQNGGPGLSRRELLARGGAAATTGYLAFGLGTASAATLVNSLNSAQVSTLTALSAATLSAGGANPAGAHAAAAAAARGFATLETGTRRQITGAINLLNAAAPGGSLARLTPAQTRGFLSQVVLAGEAKLPAADATFATAKDPSFIAFTAASAGTTATGGALGTLTGSVDGVTATLAQLPALISELTSAQSLLLNTYLLLELLDNPPAGRTTQAVRSLFGSQDPPVYPTWSPTLLNAIVTWSAA